MIAAVGYGVTVGLIDAVEFFRLLLKRLVDVILNGKSRISFKVVPQSTHQLADHNVIGVLFDNAQQKHTIVFEIFEQKGVEYFAVDERGRRRRRRVMMMRHVAQSIVDFQVAFDERQPRRARERQQPQKHAVHAHGRYQAQPKPDKYEYLLVEQVNRQRTLDRIAVIVLPERSNHKIAHRNARKPRRFPKVPAFEQVVDHLKPVNVKVGSEERVQEEKLPTYVEDVQQFGEHVQSADVVAGAVVGQQASRQAAAQSAEERIAVVVAVVVDSAVDELDGVAHRFVA